MRIAEICEKLRVGKPSVGSWMQLANISVAEIMGRAGYDWVAVDLEHGHFSNEMLPGIFAAIQSGGTLPFARVCEANRKDIKKALDAGAIGVILPMIESADQLQQAIACTLYPPQGERGVGYCRANLFGKDFQQYMEQAKDILIVAQIEHVNAIRAIDDILSVKGLDAIMVGPYDLSASMGLTGQFNHPQFLEAMMQLEKVTHSKGIPSGLHVVQPDPTKLSEVIASGHQFIAYGLDAVFLWQAAECPPL